MKEVIIYVEGPSDKYGMEVLLRQVIQMASEKGTLITFVPIKGARGQQGKEPLLNEGPKKAANILIYSTENLKLYRHKSLNKK